MKTNLTLTMILVFVLTIALTPLVFAQTATVGVNPGSTYDYTYKVNWDSTDPSASVPNLYTELNDTQFIRITIVDVTGTKINVDYTRHFNNGTEQTQNGNIDIQTQLIEIPYGDLIIRAGANSGEKIYPDGGHATLSDVATRTYSYGQVQTIKFAFEDTSSSNSLNTEIFYNKANGVGVEYNTIAQDTSGAFVTTVKETLLLTSGVVPEFPTTAALMLLLIAIPIVVIAYKKKALSKPKFNNFF